MLAKRPLSSAVSAALWVSLAFGPVLYPAWLWAVTRRRPDAEPPEPHEWPGISVVVPAYNEQSLIAAKVADVHANGYPGEVEVIVVADDRRTAEAAAGTEATVLTAGERLGKAEALNRGFVAARHPVVAMSDANTALGPGALRALARWFADPTVGGVAGEKRVLDESQGAYWRFESLLKRLEARTGSTFAMVGELGAVRRSVYRPIPPDLAVDDMWIALDVIDSGRRLVYEPSAVATEEPSTSLRDEWERRTRVVSGVLDVCWRRRRMLLPQAGPVAMQLWGHRLVRSSAGPIANALLLAHALRRARRSPWWAAFLGGHLLGVVGLVREATGAAPTAPERAAAQVVFLQAVGLGGTVRYLRRDRPALWPKPERTATLPEGLGSSPRAEREAAST